MDTKNINRRDFLKYLGGIFLTALIFPFKNFFNLNNKNIETPNLKEAKFYKQNDKLAG